MIVIIIESFEYQYKLNTAPFHGPADIEAKRESYSCAWGILDLGTAMRRVVWRFLLFLSLIFPVLGVVPEGWSLFVVA
jgi:hypothetical protein